MTDHFYNWQIVPQKKNKLHSLSYRPAIRHLRKRYLNPNSGVFFGGVKRIYNFYNKVIPIKTIKEFLSKDNSYTLHTKSFKKRYNPSFIRYKDQQMQADLIDVGNLSQNNDGIKFLLAFICSFTKKAWISPVKSKKSDVGLKALKILIQSMTKIPRSMQTDAGTELVLVRRLCAENRIALYAGTHTGI